MRILETGNLRYVRNWVPATGALSPPLLLNRWTGELRPYIFTGEARDEWGLQREIREAAWRERQARISLGMQRRHDYRMAGLFGVDDARGLLLFDLMNTGTFTTVALSTDYTAGTGGAAFSTRYQMAASKTLQDVYYFITSYTGTAANVNDIAVELRPEASAGATTPDTATLTEGKTSNPASATGWIKVTGWTSVLAAASRYYICVGDPDGATTGSSATCNSNTSTILAPSNSPALNRLQNTRTTGGFASGNTNSTGTYGCIVAVFSDSSVLGFPLTASTTPASSTNQRGLRITSSGLVHSFRLFGITWSVSSANISGMKIYTDANGPSSGADHTSTDILWAGAGRLGAMVSGGAPYLMSPGTAYSIVTTYGGAVTAGPTRLDIGTGSDANLINAMPGSGQWHWREESGGAWSDTTSSFPGYGMLIDGWVAPSGGSGGGANPIGLGSIIKGVSS